MFSWKPLACPQNKACLNKDKYNIQFFLLDESIVAFCEYLLKEE